MILELNNIKEWATTEDVFDEDDFDGEEAIGEVRESGVEIDEEHSYIMFLQGCKINLCDISILR